MHKLSKKSILTFIFSLFSLSLHASENCFIAQEKGKIVKKIGQCDKRHSPFSTFKVPLALMGFDARVLKSTEVPRVEFTASIEKNYVTFYNPQKYPIMLLWKKAQTPRSWMRDSVIWYSRYITHQLGMWKFQQYTNQFHYGNKNY